MSKTTSLHQEKHKNGKAVQSPPWFRSKEILTWTTSLGQRLPEQHRNMDSRTYCTTNWKCHNVNVQNSIWVRHSNQLRPSHIPVEIQQDPTISLNILLDTFDLPQQTPETSQNTEVETQKPNIQKSVCTRCLTQHLQVDPQMKQQNKQATQFKRGDVRTI